MQTVHITSDDGVDEAVECEAIAVFAMQPDGTTMVGFGNESALYVLLLMLATGHFTEPIMATRDAMVARANARKGKRARKDGGK